MTTVPPRVTVLLPVYNGAPYLAEAIESILQQTFSDFEFLIIDDGSTDESVVVIETFSDARIRLIRNPGNLGLVTSLNRGLQFARGEYIARMDADDISLPNRLERQVAFMDSEPEVGVSGSWMESFGLGKSVVWPAPLRHEEIVCKLLFESALFHPTVVFRRSLFQTLGLFYASEFPHAEDYELWCRSSQKMRLANIGDVLLKYRLHTQSIGRQQHEGKMLSASMVRRRWLTQLGLYNNDAIKLHDALSCWEVELDFAFLATAEHWFMQLIEVNSRKMVFPEPYFSREVAERWAILCRHATLLGYGIFSFYNRSPLCAYWKLSMCERFSFFLRAILAKDFPYYSPGSAREGDSCNVKV